MAHAVASHYDGRAHDAPAVRISVKLQIPLQKMAWAILLWTRINGLGILLCSIYSKTMINHILVVCVGNICRSPMAEALLKSALRDHGDFIVESAGLGAVVGHPADDNVLELMAEMNEDVSDHRARQIHPDMVKAADLILVMEAGHKRSIDTADPTARGKVIRLGEWQNRDIGDPYRQPKAVFADALQEIQEGVASWVQKIRA